MKTLYKNNHHSDFQQILLESSPDCFKILDENGKLQFMNHNGLCQMEIDDFSNIENRNWWDLWGDQERDKVYASVQAAKKGEKIQFTAFCSTAKGTPKWWDVLIYSITDPKDQKQKFISISRDITELKNANTKLEKLNTTLEKIVADRTRELQLLNIELKKTNKELNLFNRISSHDLQEPLRKVQMLLSRLKDNSDTKSNEIYYSKINAVLGEMRNLIESMRHLASIKEKEDEKKVCNISKIIKEVLDQSAFEEKHKIIEKISINLSENLNSILGYDFLIKQLFFNIINNSIKFRNPEKPLQIEVRNTQYCKDHRKFEVIHIRDNGLGFDQEFEKLVFQPFKKFHLHDSIKGSGLGLTICRTIMDKHKGMIKASSNLNEGCEISLYFPV